MLYLEQYARIVECSCVEISATNQTCWYMKVVPPLSSQRTYYLGAPTQEERQAWMTAIVQAKIHFLQHQATRTRSKRSDSSSTRMFETSASVPQLELRKPLETRTGRRMSVENEERRRSTGSYEEGDLNTPQYVATMMETGVFYTPDEVLAAYAVQQKLKANDRAGMKVMETLIRADKPQALERLLHLILESYPILVDAFERDAQGLLSMIVQEQGLEDRM